MRIAALTIAGGALLAGVSTSAAGDFSLRAKLQPTYTETVDVSDDFYLRGNIEAAASGTFAERFNYEFDATLSSERYYDLSFQNVDYAIAEALVSTTVAGFTGSLSATSITILAPFFEDYEGEIVDLGWSVSRTAALGNGVYLVPGFSVTRRLADTPGPERVRFSPSMELDLPLWEGILAMSASYSYADYDVGGRIDNGYDVSLSWSRRLTKRLVVGLSADFTANYSNIEGAGYQVFEIGPRLTVDLVK